VGITTLLVSANNARVSADFSRVSSDIAKNKLRLDHFDRRWAVFDAAMKLVWTAVTSGDVTQEQRVEFSVATRGVEFLFNNDLQQRSRHFLPRDVNNW
jgi:hypothetical protein